MGWGNQDDGRGTCVCCWVCVGRWEGEVRMVKKRVRAFIVCDGDALLFIVLVRGGQWNEGIFLCRYVR